MGLKPKNLARMAAWLLLLAWLWVGVAQAGKVTPVQYQEGSGGSLQIRLQSEEGAQYPPGDLILSDPEARMTGSNSRANYTYQEIPGATYRAETISNRQEAFRLEVDNAVSGTYSLRVIGVDYGRYILFMKGYDQAGNHADVRFTGGLQPGEVHHYVIHYSNRGGASLKVRRTRVIE